MAPDPATRVVLFDVRRSGVIRRRSCRDPRQQFSIRQPFE